MASIPPPPPDSRPLPPPSSPESARQPPLTIELAREQRRALGYLALGALLVVLWMAAPVAIGILFGALTGFLLEPLNQRLVPRVGAQWAASLSVLVASLVLLVSVFGLGWLFVDRGVALTRELTAAVGPGSTAERLVGQLGQLTDQFGITPQLLTEKLRDSAQALAERGAVLAAALVAASASTMLELFFAMLTMYFILLRWDELSRMAQESLPLRPDYTRSLFDEFRTVGRTTLLGTLVTGLAQGAFATVGYALGGVPQPLFWGAVTAVASLVPAIGTLLIWVPAGVVMIVSGHAFGGVLVLVWSAVFVIGVSDYVIRPRLVGGETKMPTIITFTALFGGVEVFGLKGLIVGPVLMSLAIAVLDLYRREVGQRRARAQTSTPG